MHPAIQYAMDREREERTALRDEFAAAALQGMLADVSRHQPRVGPLRAWQMAISQAAYELADAMLEARKPKA